MTYLRSLLRAAAIAISLLGATASAHEGHDHGDAAKSANPGRVTPRLEAMSGPFELVALLRGGDLVVYLDDRDTNSPIADAAITVETPSGPDTANPADGIYRLVAPWAKPGTHHLIFTVTRGDAVEVLTGTLAIAADAAATPAAAWTSLSLALASGRTGIAITVIGAFLVGWLAASVRGRKGRLANILAASLFVFASQSTHAHDGHDHGREDVLPAGDVPQRMTDGTLFVPKPVQRILAIRTVVAQTSVHRKVFELPGRIIPDPGSSGFVQASVSGRLSPPEKGFPKLGTSVKAGDVLAFVTPPLQAIDVSDMRQKAGELDQQISIVEKRIVRYEVLNRTGTVTKVALDEAVLELKGLKERRLALDKTRGEPERLLAPVSGTIAAANATAGQIAETNAVVFQIIDPACLWVEALTFSLIPAEHAASARTADGRSLSLSFQGAGLTDRSQAIPVHFSVTGETRGLRVGQLVTVFAATGEEAHGIAIPRTAILRTVNGQIILFEHTAAERFEPRIVRVEPLDAERVLVLDGIKPGARVTAQGSELLNQIR